MEGVTISDSLRHIPRRSVDTWEQHYVVKVAKMDLDSGMGGSNSQAMGMKIYAF
jgi:hypothetical protein